GLGHRQQYAGKREARILAQGRADAPQDLGRGLECQRLTLQGDEYLLAHRKDATNDGPESGWRVDDYHIAPLASALDQLRPTGRPRPFVLGFVVALALPH